MIYCRDYLPILEGDEEDPAPADGVPPPAVPHVQVNLPLVQPEEERAGVV